MSHMVVNKMGPSSRMLIRWVCPNQQMVTFQQDGPTTHIVVSGPISLFLLSRKHKMGCANCIDTFYFRGGAFKNTPNNNLLHHCRDYRIEIGWSFQILLFHETLNLFHKYIFLSLSISIFIIEFRWSFLGWLFQVWNYSVTNLILMITSDFTPTFPIDRIKVLGFKCLIKLRLK